MIPEAPREMLIKAGRGDREAFRTIVDLFGPWIFNLAWRMCRERSEAEDLSQEVFLRLFQKLSLYEADRPFAPWLRTLAVRTILNALRKKARMPLPLEKIDIPAKQAPPSAPEETREWAQALKTLPPDFRAVLTLHYFEDLPVESIAQTLNRPVGTVKTWLYRSRNMLRERFERSKVSP